MNGNKNVEEYDVHKDAWNPIVSLSYPHNKYPALFTSNNILFCLGGVSKSDKNLGCIELFDPRDNNAWIYVDHVKNYFNLPNESGAGWNCFMPL